MSVDYEHNCIAPTSRWNRAIGHLRLFWGCCPRCNSDAPAVDCCVVCRNIHEDGASVRNLRQQYPPSLATKALWWYCWLHPGMAKLQRQIKQDHIDDLNGVARKHTYSIECFGVTISKPSALTSSAHTQGESKC